MLAASAESTGIDLYAIARANGVELRTLESSTLELTQATKRRKEAMKPKVTLSHEKLRVADRGTCERCGKRRVLYQHDALSLRLCLTCFTLLTNMKAG